MSSLKEVPTARIAGNLGKNVLGTARYCVDDDRDIIAYMTVVLYSDGTCGTGGGTAFGADTPLNRYGFVGMVTEATREHLITQKTACDVLNHEYGSE